RIVDASELAALAENLTQIGADLNTAAGAAHELLVKAGRLRNALYDARGFRGGLKRPSEGPWHTRRGCRRSPAPSLRASACVRARDAPLKWKAAREATAWERCRRY